jgi:hypothetical protein
MSSKQYQSDKEIFQEPNDFPGLSEQFRKGEHNRILVVHEASNARLTGDCPKLPSAIAEVALD